ncbi:MAG: uroporphyrinogen-III synthase [Burkholderiaceae bacterium]|nr:uroporphyrinogen-III synthase [Burkholderiaceae bacterium]
MPKTLILTRPQTQAIEWATCMQALGVGTETLPLIAIEGAPDLEPVRQAWHVLPRAALAMFASPNAVQHFFQARPERVDAVWPAQTLAACAGPGSAKALQHAGVPAAQIRQPAPDAASLDSEHLWLQLQDGHWSGRLVLMLRGDGGRDWLAEQFRTRGAEVRAYAVYRRACPNWTSSETALLHRALAQPADHVWLFSSSEALGYLKQLAPQGADWSTSTAIATHARIAEAATALGFTHVVLARPDAPAVAQAVQALSERPLQSFAP